MSGIDTLIRLHRQHLDVKRAYRTKLETQRLEIMRRADAMRRELEDEKQAATVSLEGRQTFPAYAERMTQSLRALAAGMIEIDTEIARINDEIAEAFRALKSYELTRDARLRRVTEERARRDRAELDEIGAMQHHRREAL